MNLETFRGRLKAEMEMYARLKKDAALAPYRDAAWRRGTRAIIEDMRQGRLSAEDGSLMARIKKLNSDVYGFKCGPDFPD